MIQQLQFKAFTQKDTENLLQKRCFHSYAHIITHNV